MSFHCRLCFVTFLLVASLANNSFCATEKDPQRNKLRQSILKQKKELQGEITSFLTEWLVKQDIPQALHSFADSAYTNEIILQADCAGYIKGSERDNKDAVKSGVEKFLSDFTEGAAGRGLSDHLDTSRFTQSSLPKAINNVRQDRYLLIRLNANELGQLIDNPQAVKTFRSRFVGGPFYASLISVKGGILYFLWQQDGGRWKICHADMVCI